MTVMSMNASEEKMKLLELYAKLEQAEQQVRNGEVINARAGLQSLRAKYGLRDTKAVI